MTKAEKERWLTERGWRKVRTRGVGIMWLKPNETTAVSMSDAFDYECNHGSNPIRSHEP